MSDAFDPPPGDAGGLKSASRALQKAAADIDSGAKSTKGAVATALNEWHGNRSDDFRDAGAGIQAQLAAMETALSRAAQAIGAYGTALDRTTTEVAGYKQQAEPLKQHPDKNAAKIAHLEGLANTAKSHLKSLAGKLASAVDMETDVAVPQSAKLTPDQIRRRVTTSLGVSNLAKAAANGTMTPDQAWSALGAAEKAVPKKAINKDGSVNWKEALADFNDKYLGPPNALVGAASPGPAGWAVYRLLLNQREVAATAGDLRTAFDEIVGPVALNMDRGLASLTDLNDALTRFKAVDDAFSALGPAGETAEKVERAVAGGLPETGVLGALGKFGGALGAVGDVFTLIDPGVKNKYEAGGLRIAAGANLVGTGMAFSSTLLGANAVADWVPGVGEVVMVGTGLILAGDYVYHHWDQIKHGLSTAWNWTSHAVSTGWHDTTHAVSTGWHDTTHAVSTGWHDTTHAVSSGWHSATSFVGGLL
ncbi:hypothetical protein [uncultured Jatrophihabitans sp.]|uniref:hypothetical protein n=1 Tax=uncultured Jatrophihabitans sp. TaxID=1610747 RepID=UPI0035CA4D72